MESIHRPTRAIISAGAIKSNIQKEMVHIPEGTEVFAVIKANAYGHGAVPVANIAANAGVSGFGVATMDEAIELREAGITLPILILSSVSPQYLHLLQEYNLSSTLISLEWWQKAQSYVQNLHSNQPIKLHIKIDTGMNRVGFSDEEEALKVIRELENSPAFEWEGIFTHFATADEVDDSHYKDQLAKFENFYEKLPRIPRYVHLSNTATSLWREEKIGNMVRFGIGIYGLNPSGKAIQEELGLTPALQLESRIIQCKKVAKDSKIGYGATYTSEQAEWIGTVPIGYADGWLRALQGFSVLVKGQRCEIVGRVCMDQMMIRLPFAVAEGTKVTLIGPDGDDEIFIQDLAEYLGTVNYEVACLISERVPRFYA